MQKRWKKKNKMKIRRREKEVKQKIEKSQKIKKERAGFTRERIPKIHRPGGVWAKRRGGTDSWSLTSNGIDAGRISAGELEQMDDYDYD